MYRIILMIIFIYAVSINSILSEALEQGLRYLKLGNSYRIAKEFELAQEYLDKGLRIVQENYNVYWFAVAKEFYGYLYKDLGMFDESIKNLKLSNQIYSEIIKHNPGSTNALDLIISNFNKQDINKIEILNSLIKLDSLINLISTVLSTKDDNNIIQYQPLTKKSYNQYEPFPIPPRPIDNYNLTQFTILFGSGMLPTIGIGNNNIPPISLAVLYKTSEFIESGIFGTFTNEYYNSNKVNYIIIGARTSLIFSIHNWDFTINGLIGYNSHINSVPIAFPTSNNVLYGITLGIRYLISQNFGLFFEGGYGLSYTSGGFVFKF